MTDLPMLLDELDLIPWVSGIALVYTPEGGWTVTWREDQKGCDGYMPKAATLDESEGMLRARIELWLAGAIRAKVVDAIEGSGGDSTCVVVKVDSIWNHENGESCRWMCCWNGVGEETRVARAKDMISLLALVDEQIDLMSRSTLFLEWSGLPERREGDEG